MYDKVVTIESKLKTILTYKTKKADFPLIFLTDKYKKKIIK